MKDIYYLLLQESKKQLPRHKWIEAYYNEKLIENNYYGKIKINQPFKKGDILNVELDNGLSLGKIII